MKKEQSKSKDLRSDILILIKKRSSSAFKRKLGILVKAISLIIVNLLTLLSINKTKKPSNLSDQREKKKYLKDQKKNQPVTCFPLLR